MKITQFKTLLASHGADISRWEGVNVAQVRDFMENSPEARTLYEEAAALDRALNSFTVPAMDDAVLDRVMAKIGGAAPEEAPALASATVHEFAPRRPRVLLARPLTWGGMAVAACAMFVFFAFQTPQAPQNPAPQAEVDTVLAELEQAQQEEIVAQDIISLWETAELSTTQRQDSAQPLSDQDIDSFLNQMFPVPVDDPSLLEQLNGPSVFRQRVTYEL